MTVNFDNTLKLRIMSSEARLFFNFGKKNILLYYQLQSKDFPCVFKVFSVLQ